MADDYRNQQDQLFQEMADREAESIRREREDELRRMLVARGADRKLIDRILKEMRGLANLRQNTATGRQADYDDQVKNWIADFKLN